VALADDFNSYKLGSEQLFHTRAKPFTALHPMGVFANHPESLQLADRDIIDVPGTKSDKMVVSSKHQILLFVTLLETNKPYLVNAFRMPAVQTLLLFSQSVDTNSDISRLVCDGWLELRFTEPSAGQSLLLRACKLRHRWNELLMLRLLEDPGRKPKDKEALEKRLKRMQRDLHYDLIAFTQTQVLYSIKRLLAADLKVIYRGVEEDDANVEEGKEEKKPTVNEVNPFWPEFVAVVHPRKGGLQMADFLVYGWYIFTLSKKLKLSSRTN
jgi:hypothetical protein